MDNSYQYRTSQNRNLGDTRSPSVASRTPICFSETLAGLMKQFLPDFSLQLSKSTDDHFLYLYRKPLGKMWQAFALFLVARKRGFFNVEVGISKRKTYPYFWSSALPDYSIDSVRERLGLLMDVEDTGWRYLSSRELQVRLEEVIRGQIGSAIHTLMEQKRKTLEMQLNDYIQKVQAIRQRMDGQTHINPAQLFPESPRVTECFELIEKYKSLGSYGRLFSREIQLLMFNTKFNLIQAKLMADIIERPDIRYLALSKGSMKEYKDDLIFHILNRIPQNNYFLPIEDEEEQIKLYGYLKSLSAMESVIGYEKEEMDEIDRSEVIL